MLAVHHNLTQVAVFARKRARWQNTGVFGDLASATKQDTDVHYDTERRR